MNLNKIKIYITLLLRDKQIFLYALIQIYIKDINSQNINYNITSHIMYNLYAYILEVK